jgi:hypothetical protein
LPEGVFYWDGSTKGVLLMLYLAKQLYPERFPISICARISVNITPASIATP